MNDTIKNIFRVKAANDVNVFIYYFKRLWLIGGLLKDDVYADHSLKNSLMVIVEILSHLTNLLRKVFYTFIIAGIPIIILSQEGDMAHGTGFSCLVHIVFFLSCLLGSLSDSVIFGVDQIKVICIKYLHINPKNYVKAIMLIKYVPFYISFLLIFIVTGLITGGSITQALLLWIALLSFRMLGEALQLFVYDKKGLILSRNNTFVWLLIPLALAAAYVPLLLGWSPVTITILFHPISVLLYSIVGSISIYYIFCGYQNYQSKFARTVDTNLLLSSIREKSKKNTFVAVQMKDEDLKLSKSEQGHIAGLKGYAYLNAIFFSRHRRLLLKPVYYRLALIAAVFTAGIVLYLLHPESAVSLSKKVNIILPSMVFVMYCITITDKACKAMFYNCDISLLRFGFYRKPKTILSNFFTRLIRFSAYNLIIGLAICLALAGFMTICGAELFTADMLMIFLAILLLAVFFTVHYLFLYYVFQPYSTGLDVKNPYYKAINIVIYIICYTCLQVKAGGVVFTAGVLAFTMIYIAMGLIIVYKYAPSHFRVK